MANETITESDIWADIDAVFEFEPRQPGDLDATQFMEHQGCAYNTALNRMNKLVRDGDYIDLIVADTSSLTGKRKVIRKVKNGSHP